MSELVTIVMEPRVKEGKGAVGRLRKAGFTPCVFYGPELPEPVVGKIDTTRITRLLESGHWETMRLTLKLPSGSEEMCIIREVQRNPLTGGIVHIDFMRLLKGRKITVNVPIRIHGKEACPGIKDGGVLENLHEIEIETLPMDIPESIDVDISGLALGEMIHVGDLDAGGFTLLADPEEVVAIVATPRAVAEETPGEEKEVEVLAKGKGTKAEE
ncbi:MAG: 50S ribosomal protein L25 [Synergistaceae bacterium]|nr:50S ribosomal protein L25 [Synergistaceae bacterium]